MTFEPFKFVESLKYMAVGMIGIFLVIGVIVLVTLLLNKVFKEKNNNNQ